MNTTDDLKMRPFDVHIPNLDGDAIAETVQIQVPVRIDPKSGNEILTPEAQELIAKTKARLMGLMAPEELRELREERLNLTQEEMSDLLQIGAKTYTRWESGRGRPSRSLNVMLCALRDGQLDVNYLRALRDPSARAAWTKRKVSQVLFTSYFTHMAKAPQPESKRARVQAWKPSSSSWWILWEHQHPGSEIIMAPHHGTSKSNLLAAFHRSFRGKPAESELRETPPLPSSRKQRETFIRHRFQVPMAEDPISG